MPFAGRRAAQYCTRQAGQPGSSRQQRKRAGEAPGRRATVAAHENPSLGCVPAGSAPAAPALSCRAACPAATGLCSGGQQGAGEAGPGGRASGHAARGGARRRRRRHPPRPERPPHAPGTLASLAAPAPKRLPMCMPVTRPARLVRLRRQNAATRWGGGGRPCGDDPGAAARRPPGPETRLLVPVAQASALGQLGPPVLLCREGQGEFGGARARGVGGGGRGIGGPRGRPVRRPAAAGATAAPCLAASRRPAARPPPRRPGTGRVWRAGRSAGLPRSAAALAAPAPPMCLQIAGLEEPDRSLSALMACSRGGAGGGAGRGGSERPHASHAARRLLSPPPCRRRPPRPPARCRAGAGGRAWPPCLPWAPWLLVGGWGRGWEGGRGAARQQLGGQGGSARKRAARQLNCMGSRSGPSRLPRGRPHALSVP